MSFPHLSSSRTERSIGLFEVFVLAICVVGITSVLLLVLNHFNPLHALIIGVFLSLLLLRLFSFKIVLPNQRFDLFVFLILLIALFFTVKPYLYVVGGQDQGVYMSMSATYEKTGDIFVTDQIRNKLTNQEKELYDLYNHYARDVVITGRHEGTAVPGLYIQNLAESEYVFQFYPLHPLWMSIFGAIFGSDNRVYSLVFFSLLAILGFFFLGREMSGGKKLPGYLIALFLAINPLFSFFSKFPASEILLTAFSSLGFYYLVRYYREAHSGKANELYLWLSSLAFLNLFLDHISGFIYLPLFYLLLIIVLTYVTDARTKKALTIYCISVFVGYLFSFVYGWIYSFPYSYAVYSIEFSKLIFFNWKIELLLGIVLMLAIPYIVIRFKQKIRQWTASSLSHLSGLIAVLIVLLIPINIYQAYHLGLSLDAINTDFVYSASSYITLLYLTPFGCLLFLLALQGVRKWRNPLYSIFLVFLLFVWTAKVFFSVSMGYQYFSSRYLLSEVIVYSLLLIALYGAHLFEQDKKRKVLAVILIGGISLYSLYFTVPQLQGQEVDGAHQALVQVAKNVDEKDLLLVGFADYRLLTPLRYYYGLNTFAVSTQEINDQNFVRGFYDRFNDILVLSLQPLSHEDLYLVDIISYKEGVYEHPIDRIPTQFYYHEYKNLYLYRINSSDTSILPSDYILENFYDDHRWTNGAGTIKGLSVSVKPEDQYLVLRTGGSSPYTNEPDMLRLKVLVNNIELPFYQQKHTDYYFHLSGKSQEINEVTIMSSTFVPEKLGINTDSRTLGIDINSIHIE